MIYKVPKYVKNEIIKQAERIGEYKIGCYIDRYGDFIDREIWEIGFFGTKWFQFVPDIEIKNDWYDEIYQLKKYVDEIIGEDGK